MDLEPVFKTICGMVLETRFVEQAAEAKTRETRKSEGGK